MKARTAASNPDATLWGHDVKPHERTRAVWAALTKNPRMGYRELIQAAGLSSTGVARYHVQKLIWLGYVSHQPGTARGFVINVPLIDQVKP